jgi:putative transposase
MDFKFFCMSRNYPFLPLFSSCLGDVPHRQVVLSVPKRLRPYFLYDRKLLGELSRVAARTVTSFIRATVDEKDLSVGIVSSIQTHGSLANWHPHLHLLVTDGGFRPDGTFVHLPLHDVAILTEAFRRAVLKMFVKRELMDIETAQGMIGWPHSGFHTHDGVWVAADDTEFTVRWSLPAGSPATAPEIPSPSVARDRYSRDTMDSIRLVRGANDARPTATPWKSRSLWSTRSPRPCARQNADGRNCCGEFSKSIR